MTPITRQKKPFGLWPSPITPQTLGQSIRLDDVQWDHDGQSLIWSEGRSNRKILVTQRGSDARRDLLSTLSLSGGVGYGGGEFGVHNGQVFFTEREGKLYSQSLAFGQPTPLTPAFGGIASPAVSPDGKWVAYVFSDGNFDCLSLVDARGQGWPVQLARGADFYMQPAWHPSGERIAWVEWSHPNMPWDGTRVKLARLAGSPPQLVDEQIVGGGDSIAAQQPAFSPDGRWLCFIEANHEWENLILVDLNSGQRRVLFEGNGFHFCTPAWGQGQRHFGWSPSSQALYAVHNFGGVSSLHCVALNGSSTQIDTAPYSSIAQIAVSPSSEQVAFIASGPTTPDRIVLWNGSHLQVIARSETETLDPAYAPEPSAIQWRASDGSPVYGIYYPPTHPAYEDSGPPPAILSIHGGPTGGNSMSWSSSAAYFTSRGYAYVYVSYRGSTGYGRTYREALRQHWGDYDVEDSVSCARWLVQQKLADEKRLIIMGGSAGGYTVLNAMIRYPQVFKAGVCLYGVSNLFTLDLDTHKFEQHYTHSLVGALPEASALYHAWSPIYHADKIENPMIIFQGSQDKVVPPVQSDEIVAVLASRKIPHKYRLYEGEGHGFRKSENISDFYTETERFLIQHVLFAP
jgi:dipeptidyl aminopeptidase/acylaminoacyl peptidase